MSTCQQHAPIAHAGWKSSGSRDRGRAHAHASAAAAAAAAIGGGLHPSRGGPPSAGCRSGIRCRSPHQQRSAAVRRPSPARAIVPAPPPAPTALHHNHIVTLACSETGPRETTIVKGRLAHKGRGGRLLSRPPRRQTSERPSSPASSRPRGGRTAPSGGCMPSGTWPRGPGYRRAPGAVGTVRCGPRTTRPSRSRRRWCWRAGCAWRPTCAPSSAP